MKPSPKKVSLNSSHVALVAAVVVAAPASAEESRPWALTTYGFWMTANDWERAIMPWQAEFIDSGGIALALSRRIGSLFDDDLAIELEGIVAGHFGGQDNWEVDLPVIARWQRFPWDSYVDTSIAFGLGLSFASEDPATEVERQGHTEQLMFYWAIETAVGPPAANWEVVLRLHHRSTGYGTFGEDGGSNALGLGLRFRF